MTAAAYLPVPGNLKAEEEYSLVERQHLRQYHHRFHSPWADHGAGSACLF